MLEEFAKSLALFPDDSFLESSAEELAALASIELPTDLFEKACSWATDVQDGKLLLQLTAMRITLDAARSMALAETQLRQAVAAGSKGNRICKKHVEVFNDLHSRYAALVTFTGTSESSMHADSDDFHLPNADDMLNFSGVSVALAAESSRLQHALPALWSAGVKDLLAAVNAFVPAGWEPFKERVLQTPAILKAFLDMPEVHYNRLGPLAKHIDSSIVMIKSAGRHLDVNLEKAAKDARNLASTTAVFKFVITAVKKDFLSLPSPAECADAVQKLRGHISPFKVQLSAELEQELEDWGSGKKLEELQCQDGFARVPAPQPAGPVFPGPSEVSEVDEHQASPSPQAPASPLPATPSATTSEPEIGGNSLEEKIADMRGLTLKEKIAAAKRRRTE